MMPLEETAPRAYEVIVIDWIKADSAGNWIKGDLAGEVETVYGQNRLGEFARDVETPLTTVRELRRVAVAYPETSRRLDISWSVHQALACMPNRAQLIDGWSGTVAEARELVRTRNAPMDPTGDPPAAGPTHLKPPAGPARPDPVAETEWVTPQDVVDALAADFGPFDLDPCATPGSAKAPDYYTKEDDGLSRPWHGRVFCNPPYSGGALPKWLAKAADETSSGRAERVVCLVRASVGAAWYREAEGKAALVRVWPGRIRFSGSDPAPFDSAVMVFGTLPGVPEPARGDGQAPEPDHQATAAADESGVRPAPVEPATPKVTVRDIAATVKSDWSGGGEVDWFTDVTVGGPGGPGDPAYNDVLITLDNGQMFRVEVIELIPR